MFSIHFYTTIETLIILQCIIISMSMSNMWNPSKKIKINIEFNKTNEKNINTIHDKVILSMLEDSAKHNTTLI